MSTTQSEADFDVIPAIKGPSTAFISFDLFKGFDVAPRTPYIKWNGGIAADSLSGMIFKVSYSALMANPFASVSYNFNGGVIKGLIDVKIIAMSEFFHIKGPYTIKSGRLFHAREIK
jgi:hypothetical protein